MMPRFSVLVSVLIEFGAVFAVPSIRGGSEFGRDWYEAGRRRNRQKSFTDFLLAAEWLCANGVTTPTKIAVFGGSNSGLLAEAVAVQRPDLFGAVVCIAPLLDMLRYEQFDQARKWTHEYGSVEDPDDFRALLAYSPYQNIRAEIDYPATLFITGDKDDRCNPAHVRKMAARLQCREAQSNPILVDYSAERGHSPTMPLSIRVQSLARRIAFICNELDIATQPGGGDETTRL
jgi:prolyl oligopeptidase